MEELPSCFLEFTSASLAAASTVVAAASSAASSAAVAASVAISDAAQAVAAAVMPAEEDPEPVGYTDGEWEKRRDEQARLAALAEAEKEEGDDEWEELGNEFVDDKGTDELNEKTFYQIGQREAEEAKENSPKETLEEFCDHIIQTRNGRYTKQELELLARSAKHKADMKKSGQFKWFGLF